MARGLLRYSDPQTVYWMRDYAFLTLGAEIRQLRIERPIGFFLHTPWAERGTMLAGAASRRSRAGDARL